MLTTSWILVTSNKYTYIPVGKNYCSCVVQRYGFPDYRKKASLETFLFVSFVATIGAASLKIKCSTNEKKRNTHK